MLLRQHISIVHSFVSICKLFGKLAQISQPNPVARRYIIIHQGGYMLDFKTVHHEETCYGDSTGFDYTKHRPSTSNTACPKDWLVQTYPWQESDCDQKRVGPPRRTTASQT